MNFGQNIKRLRNERNWTQVELAEKLNISQKAITSYERGTREPNIEKIQAIAHVFEVSVDELFGRAAKTKKLNNRIHKNSRTSKVQELYEKLRPNEQRVVLSQIKGILAQR